MSVPSVVAPAAFEERLERYLFERSEEGRRVRVGEKEVSEQAAIVARYADLFTRAQLDALRAAEDAASDADERERLYRLRSTCEGGIVVAELAERSDALENAILAARIDWQGEELPLRTAQARLAVEPAYGDREALGEAQLAVSAGFNDERRALLRDAEALEAELSGEPDAVRRSEDEKQIALQPLLDALDTARVHTAAAYQGLRERWLERLLGQERDGTPSSFHVPWIRRLSPLEATYTKERAVPVSLATLAGLGFQLEQEQGIRLDLDDRPQKSPRACVIASDPPRVVWLITRSQGGVHDYEALLHEAGHALHYAGLDPALPFPFRRLSRDHALTEIYSFLLDSIAREPGWHAEHFRLSDGDAAERAEATCFVNALLYRRYTAKLAFELDFWRRFADDGGTPAGYEQRLTAATGIRYRAEAYLSDLDGGFYSADYLRAWVRAAQLRERLRRDAGTDWWRSPQTGAVLRELFREGTRPSSEEIAARIGFDPLDTAPLEAELAGPSR
jgi:hypothetical protein